MSNDGSRRPICTCGGEDCDGRGDVLDCPVHGIGPHGPHGRETVPCGWCDGSGEANNPLNADPNVAILDWHPPVACPRCFGTGRDPDGTPHPPPHFTAVTVFSRPECVFRYCPNPGVCQTGCMGGPQ